MNDVAVTLMVPLASSWPAEATLELYTNGGSGEVDLTDPLWARALPTGRHVRQPKGLGLDPLGEMPLGLTGPDYVAETLGLGEIPLGDGPLGESIEIAEVEVQVEQGCGMYKFAAKVRDGEGNFQGDAAVEFDHFVAGTDPPQLKSLTYGSYDSENDQCSFAFSL